MKLLRDTNLLFRRSMLVSLRNIVWVFLGIFQPLLYLLLFGPLLDRLVGMPGFTGDNALNVFAPGLVIMTALYSAAFVGFSLMEDLRSGMIERLGVTPANRLSLLLGPVLRDVVQLLVQSAVLVGVATLMGLRADPLGLVLLFALMALMGAMIASVSYALTLVIKDEGGLAAALNTITLPLMLLSGVMLPLTFAPAIIRTLSQYTPFSHTVNAARALVNGDLASSAVPLGFAVIVALMIPAVWWAVRSFRQATA